MNVLLIGAAGLVGLHLRAAFAGEHVMATSHRMPAPDAVPLDLTDFAAVRHLIAALRPEVILLAAAEAHVERCEQEPTATRRVNVEAARVVADAAREAGSLLVVFSSEYVFDGRSGPYKEEAPVCPINEYGRQKVQLEAIARRLEAHLVCRTSGVFGWEPLGKNFVCQLVRRLRAGEAFEVPDDQVLTPTYAPELARAVAELVRRRARGTFHVVGPRPIVRTEFARLVAKMFELPPDLIRPQPTTALGFTAPRPGLRAGLRDAKLRRSIGHGLLNLPKSLAAMRRAEPVRGRS